MDDISKHIIIATFSGGLLASAWVTMKALGVQGYMQMAKTLMETTDRLKDGINNIEVKP